MLAVDGFAANDWSAAPILFSYLVPSIIVYKICATANIAILLQNRHRCVYFFIAFNLALNVEKSCANKCLTYNIMKNI